MQLKNKNAIERLHNIVNGLKKYPSTNPIYAFSDIFDIESDGTITTEMLISFSDLLKLCDKSYSIIEQNFPEDDILKDLISDTFKALSTINFNSSTGLNLFKSSLEDTTIMGLRTLAITTPVSENTLDEENLKSIYSEIDDLLKRIIDSDINKHLKLILTDRLNEILTVIRKYKIVGSTEVIKSIENSIGSILVNQNDIKTDSERSLCRDIFSKLTNALSVLSNSVTLIEGCTEISKKLL